MKINELSHVETLVGRPLQDTIIIGDLNADGSYYDEDIILHFTTRDWIITNDIDTTVAASDNTYDRIIINDGATNNFFTFFFSWRKEMRVVKDGGCNGTNIPSVFLCII